MSEAYEAFASEIYQTVIEQVEPAVAASGDLPVLVISGNEHIDGGLERNLNMFTAAPNEEPAMAGAYTHIAAIKASADLVGDDNVIVSFEFDQDKLEERVAMVQQAILDPLVSLESVLQENGLEGRPVYYAMEYALEQGYEVVASDPWHKSPSALDPKRFSGEIEALGQYALRYEDRPEVVVHIGGSSHFGTLQGHDLNDVLSGGAALTREGAISPFDGIYGGTVFFNSYQPGPGDGIISYFSDADDYARASGNAVQVDPPGQMDNSDKTLIAERIDSASDAYREAHAPETELAPTDPLPGQGMNR